MENFDSQFVATLFRQLPLLEYEGKTVNQSIAICRYVGKLANLSGDNDWEDLEMDAVVDTISDLRHSKHAILIFSLFQTFNIF